MMIKIIQDSGLSHNKIQSTEISKVKNDTKVKKTDYLAVETPLEIRLGHGNDEFSSLAITLCSPDDIEDLVYGYLFTENIITQADNIIGINIFDNDFGLIAEITLDKSITYAKFLNKRHGRVHASCGICGKTEFDDLLTIKYDKIKQCKVEPTVIKSLPKKLYQAQIAFKQTGGLHACALFDSSGEIITVKEDIGRHNALDKLIGVAIQQNLLPLSDHVILLSGRVSFELVHKSLMSGVSTLCAIGAPSSLSVEIANLNKLNLIGFLKAEKFNIYSGVDDDL